MQREPQNGKMPIRWEEIDEALKTGEKVKSLAHQYGISTGAIYAHRNKGKRTAKPAARNAAMSNMVVAKESVERLVDSQWARLTVNEKVKALDFLLG